MNSVKLTADQIAKTRAKLAELGKAANAAFRSANEDYKDQAVNYDDLQVIKAMEEGTSRGGDTTYNKEKLAEIRTAFVSSDRSTYTLDRMTVKTDDGVDEADKYTMSPYLFAKQSRSEKVMYQEPKAESAKMNSFLDKDGQEHKILRAKRVFQLASDAEIDEFVKDLNVSLDLFIQLNF